MEKEEHVYIAIDLKSFYASVECVERGLNPLTTNLVVADTSRTEKTICLAVSPSLKSYGISGRARLFEVVQKVKEINAVRQQNALHRHFLGSSYDACKLAACKELALDYIAAPPRMSYYMEYSTKIYDIYLKYVAPEDMHVYSVDEVFLDVTHYLSIYHMTPRQLAMRMVYDVLQDMGITATAGIGTNLYLCKIAMDIVAKKAEPDSYGVRIAELDEMSYRSLLWTHKPITDFWRVGAGYARKLYQYGLYTMGDIARCSLGKPGDFYQEDLLYKLFGINAELLIDHAWGWEPVTMSEIKAYRPSTNSLSTGQVLQCPYNYEKARLIVREMTDLLVLDLVDKQVVTDQITLTIGYDIENLQDEMRKNQYHGEITIDHYGRRVPKHATGSCSFPGHMSSTRQIMAAVMTLYTRIVNPSLTIRRIHVTANHLISEEQVISAESYEQLSFFEDMGEAGEKKKARKREEKKEKSLQHAVLSIKKKYGKNAILKGMNLEEGAMTIKRNRQIGGHKA